VHWAVVNLRPREQAPLPVANLAGIAENCLIGMEAY